MRQHGGATRAVPAASLAATRRCFGLKAPSIWQKARFLSKVPSTISSPLLAPMRVNMRSLTSSGAIRNNQEARMSIDEAEERGLVCSSRTAAFGGGFNRSCKAVSRKFHRLVGEKGCDPVPPFRTMIPPKLRLKCEGPSRVRSSTTNLDEDVADTRDNYGLHMMS